MLTTIVQQVVGSLQTLYVHFVTWVPQVIGAFVVLFVGAYLAKLIRNVVKKVLRLIKLEMASDRFGVNEKVKKLGVNATVTDVLAGLVYWLVLLVFISAAASVLGIEVVTKFINQLIGWLPSIFAGLAIMVLGVVVAETLERILEKVEHGVTYKKVVRWFILVVAFITAVEQIGIDISFLTDNIQILVGGVALAFGIAFGLGGQAKAKEFLDSHLK